ncbi:MAG: hypothetical protein DMG07_15110, partial [Acidobacteria bacterium]
TYGEKVYAVKPTADYAFYIAASYKKLGNEARYQEWMTKALTYPEYAERAIGFLMEPVDKYAKEKNLAKAAEYAGKALDGLQTVKRPAAAPEADWNGKVRAARRGCHYIIGLDLYEKQKYAEAIKKMEAALGLDPHFDMAYYYIGLSQWKLGKVENEEAPLSFAKAYLLKGEMSEQAKEHLEKIYKAIHNNTLINIQKIYDRAKEELATVQRTASNK